MSFSCFNDIIFLEFDMKQIKKTEKIFYKLYKKNERIRKNFYYFHNYPEYRRPLRNPIYLGDNDLAVISYACNMSFFTSATLKRMNKLQQRFLIKTFKEIISDYSKKHPDYVSDSTFEKAPKKSFMDQYYLDEIANANKETLQFDFVEEKANSKQPNKNFEKRF